MEQWLNAAVYGVALAIVAWAAARPRLLAAAWRCRIWEAALAALAAGTLLPGLQALAVRSADALPRAGAARSSFAATPDPIVTIPSLAIPVIGLMAAWAAVALIRAAVLAAAIVRIRRARRAAHEFPADRLARLPEWTAASQGRFSLVLSDRVHTAAMFGFGRPMVAVPPAWLSRLSDAQLDAVLLHELAHAERRDDVGELVEQLLLAACWFHPCAWWAARQAAFEREAACDERAARATTSRRYARCLVAIAETMHRPASPALIASSAGRRGDVVRRVEGVMAMEGQRPVARLGYVAAPTLAAIAALAIAIPAFPRVLGVEAGVVRGQGARWADDIRLEPDATKRIPDERSSGRTRGGRFNVRLKPDATKRTPDARSSGQARGGGFNVGLKPDATTRRESVELAPVATRNAPEPLAAVARTPSTILPSSGAPAPVALTPRGSTLAAPFVSAGASLSNAGKRTGSWFSRAGSAVANGVAPR